MVALNLFPNLKEEPSILSTRLSELVQPDPFGHHTHLTQSSSLFSALKEDMIEWSCFERLAIGKSSFEEGRDGMMGKRLSGLRCETFCWFGWDWIYRWGEGLIAVLGSD